MDKQIDANAFFRILDNYKSLFNLSLSAIETAISVYIDVTGYNIVPLHKFTCSPDDALIFFPCYNEAAKLLINLLVDVKDDGNKFVSLLDLLTLFVLLSNGDPARKYGYFFDWYRICGLELMSELETTLFIVRYARCMNALHLIGRIDITMADAQHEAFRARLDRSTGIVQKGLNLSAFITWLTGRPESKLFDRFVVTLTKLVEMLSFLNRRSQRLLSIISEKDEYVKSSGDLVPPLDICKSTRFHDVYREISVELLLLERENDFCTFYVKLSRPIKIFPRQIYVKVEDKVIVELTDSKTYLDNSVVNDRGAIEQYVRRTYYKQCFGVSDSSDRSSLGFRVIVPVKKMNGKYHLTFYFPNNIILGESDLNYDGCEVAGSAVDYAVVCPSSIPVYDALKVFRSQQEKVDYCQRTCSLLISGGVCCMEKIFSYEFILSLVDSIHRSDCKSTELYICSIIRDKIQGYFFQRWNSYFMDIVRSVNDITSMSAGLLVNNCMIPECMPTVDSYGSIVRAYFNKVKSLVNIENVVIEKLETLESICISELCKVWLYYWTPLDRVSREYSVGQTYCLRFNACCSVAVAFGSLNNQLEKFLITSNSYVNIVISIPSFGEILKLENRNKSEFCNFIKLLLNIIEASKANVYLLSLAWDSGVDFNIYCRVNESRISHYSLYGDGEKRNDGGKLSVSQFSEVFSAYSDYFTEKYRIDGVVIGSSRIVTVDSAGIKCTSVQCAANVIDSPLRKRISKKFRICSSPHVLYLTSSEICVGLSSIGEAMVHCHLYCAPMYWSLDDAVTLIRSGLRNELKLVCSISKLAFLLNEAQDLSFVFNDLVPFSAYVVVIDGPFNVCEVLYMRTLPTTLPIKSLGDFIPNDPVSTILYGFGNCLNDISYRSKNLFSILSKLPNPIAASVYLLFSSPIQKLEDKVHLMSDCTLKKFYKMSNDMTIQFMPDLEKLSKQFQVSHVGFDGGKHYSQMSLVNMEVQGTCARLSCKWASAECVGALSVAVRNVQANLPNIRTILILHYKPLIHFSCKSGINLDAFQDPSERLVVIELIDSLLSWKFEEGSFDRDCLVFTTFPVPYPIMTFLFRWNEDNVEQVGLIRDELHQNLKSFKNREVCFMNSMSIRCCVLPNDFGKSVDCEFIFPPNFSILTIGDILGYLVTPVPFNEHFADMEYRRPKEEFCCSDIVQPICYIVDVFPLVFEMDSSETYGVSSMLISKSKSNMLLYSEDQQNDDLFLASAAQRFHLVSVRALLSEYDEFEICYGPFVGHVTETSATIMLEINLPLKYLKLVLVCEKNGLITEKIIHNVSAKVVIGFSFDNLESGCRYNVYFPQFRRSELQNLTELTRSNPRKLEELPWATFRTKYFQNSILEFKLTGGEIFDSETCLSAWLSAELQNQQMLYLDNYFEKRRVLSYLKYEFIGPETDIGYDVFTRCIDNNWRTLVNYIDDPHPSSAIVLHVGSFDIVKVLSRSEGFIAFLKKCSDILDSCVNNLIFDLYTFEIEEMLKTLFRAFFSIPVVKFGLQHGVHVPLFWSSVPVVCESSKLQNIFRKCIYSYLGPFSVDFGFISPYQLLAEVNIPQLSLQETEHCRVMRYGTILLVSFYFDVNNPNLKDVFAPNPIQLQILESLMKDVRVTQLFLFARTPWISCSPLSDSNDHEGIIAGLLDDLFEWLAPQFGCPRYRNFALIGSFNKPFFTRIAHVRSGLSTLQLCVQNLTRKFDAFDDKDAVVEGTIGKYNFFHVFEQSSVLKLHSSTESDGILRALKGENDFTVCNSINHYDSKDSFFSTLKIWNDQSNFNSAWELLPNYDSGESRLIVGPILGAFRTEHSSSLVNCRGLSSGLKLNDSVVVYLPILFEFDRDTTVELKVQNSLFGKECVVSIQFPAWKPHVIEIGPLESGCTYVGTFLSGFSDLSSANFKFTSHYMNNEDNIVCLNLDSDQEVQSHSTRFLDELTERCSVPFHGISYVTHTNMKFVSSLILQEIKCIPQLEKIIFNSVNCGCVTDECNILIAKILGILRNEMRTYLTRPSYRKLLRTCFNLFVPSTAYSNVNLEIEHSVDMSINRLLRLCSLRVQQEYLDQLRYPGENVFCLKKSRVVAKELLQRASDLNEKKEDFADSQTWSCDYVPLYGLRTENSVDEPVEDNSGGLGSLFLSKGVTAPYILSNTSSLARHLNTVMLKNVKHRNDAIPVEDTAFEALMEEIGTHVEDTDSVSEMVGVLDTVSHLTIEETMGNGGLEFPAAPVSRWSSQAVSRVGSGQKLIKIGSVNQLGSSLGWKSLRSMGSGLELSRLPSCLTYKSHLDKTEFKDLPAVEIFDIVLVDDKLEASVAVFELWMFGMDAREVDWCPFPSLNGKSSFEILRAPTIVNLTTLMLQLDSSPIQSGCRIVMLDSGDPLPCENGNNPSEAPLEDPFNPTANFEQLFNGNNALVQCFQQHIHTWLKNRGDRSMVIMCSSLAHGTKMRLMHQIEPTDPLVRIYTVDSCFKDNILKAERLHLDQEEKINYYLEYEKNNVLSSKGTIAVMKPKIPPPVNERILNETPENRFMEILSNLPSDGYVLIDTKFVQVEVPSSLLGGKDPNDIPIVIEPTPGTTEIVPVEEVKEEVVIVVEEQISFYSIATSSVTIVNGLHLKGFAQPVVAPDFKSNKLPSDFHSVKFDTMMLPRWLKSFSPSANGVVYQDEIIFYCRNNLSINAILSHINSSDFFDSVLGSYESSRLSLLSRPKYLREFDANWEDPGILWIFVKEYIMLVWSEVLPFDFRTFFGNLNDEFLLKFAFGRVYSILFKEVSLYDVCSDPMNIARSIQVLFEFLLKMNVFLVMVKDSQFEFLLNVPLYDDFNIAELEESFLLKYERIDDLYVPNAKEDGGLDTLEREMNALENFRLQEELAEERRLEALDRMQQAIDALAIEAELKALEGSVDGTNSLVSGSKGLSSTSSPLKSIEGTNTKSGESKPETIGQTKPSLDKEKPADEVQPDAEVVESIEEVPSIVVDPKDRFKRLTAEELKHVADAIGHEKLIQTVLLRRKTGNEVFSVFGNLYSNK